MKITQQDEHALVIEDFPYLIGAIAFPAALFLLYQAIVTAARAGLTRNAIGAAFGALLFFFGGAVFTKRSVFEFDRVHRQLLWKRGGLFTRTRGVVPFDDIRTATVQSLGAGGSPTYRVALLTSQGDIPLTDAYTSGIDKPERVRTAINQLFDGAAPANETENDIRQMARAGQKIEAIRLARARYGYDLAQARDFVERLLG